jgi:hypothetical protein
MFSHANIWSAIDRLAARHGISPSALAKKAGLDPTTFNKSKRTSAEGKPRWPSTESISKILNVTGESMASFFYSQVNDLPPQCRIYCEMKDGTIHKGRLVISDTDTYTLKTSHDDQLTIDKALVANVALIVKSHGD